MPANKPGFSQRHPFLFGLTLILAAVALLTGAMAAFRYFVFDGGAAKVSLGESIGVVRVSGLIAESEDIVDWLRTLENDDSVKGVILRINSPGGVVAPSQEIYHAVRRISGKKPVVASMAAVAASGGYYVAAGAREIVANSGTLTGSIGVRTELANFQGLMEKIGVSHTLITSGALKGTGSPFQPLTPEQRAYLESMVMDLHRQFVQDVADAREMDVAAVEAVADGRALTGRQALDAGLVDVLGGMEVAVERVKELAGISGEIDLREKPKEELGFLRELLMSSLGIDPASLTSLSAGPRMELRYQ